MIIRPETPGDPAFYRRFGLDASGNRCFRGKPIVPTAVLERYFPNALNGISWPSQSIVVKDTLIVFVDLSRQLRFIADIESARETARTPDKGGK